MPPLPSTHPQAPWALLMSAEKALHEQVCGEGQELHCGRGLTRHKRMSRH